MDLYDSLKYVLSSQRFNRLAVFRVDKSGTKVVTDKREIFWSLLLIALIILEVGFIGHKVYFEQPENFFQTRADAKGFRLFSLVGYLEFTLTIINSVYFVLVALWKRRDQVKFIEKIQKIDDSIRNNFKIKINYNFYKLTSIVSLIVVVLYYNVIVSAVMYFFMLDIGSPSAMTTFSCYIAQSATSGIFTYGFVCYVILVMVRLAKINGKLHEIVRYPPEMLEKQYKTKDALCNEMLRYTKMYKNLCSCVDDLNEIYGSSMVLQFAHDFTLLTTQIFGMFYIGFFDDPEESILKIMALAVWLLPNIFKMTLICFFCHLTRHEIETCGLYLRKFSNEANEDELTDFVDMLSLQNIHLKTEFSANNFFSIDMSLFFTIISACTTYLVILIQFKNYEDENGSAVMANMTSNITKV